MIKASHNKAARFIFNFYIDRLLRKNFSHFYLTNEAPNTACKDFSLIVTPNHISWWDGFFIDFINRKIFRRTFHIMMLEEQLKRYWFFRYLGAYSIMQHKPKSIINTASYLKELSEKHGSLNVIYPQGAIEPYDKRPPIIKSGLKFFLRDLNESTIVLPVLFKIQYEDKMKPSVYCRFGQPVQASKVIADFEAYIRIFDEALCGLDTAAFEKLILCDLFRN